MAPGLRPAEWRGAEESKSYVGKHCTRESGLRRILRQFHYHCFTFYESEDFSAASQYVFMHPLGPEKIGNPAYALSIN
ncbi:hypothetical protein ACO0K9_23520 [Undibacterium sp. Ji50W]|uniref:hypothetical protein n=1 Tax=Undibacterium sp. Ji50W TaxID=3413041 RepID=UPI003BF38A31